MIFYKDVAFKKVLEKGTLDGFDHIESEDKVVVESDKYYCSKGCKGIGFSEACKPIDMKFKQGVLVSAKWHKTFIPDCEHGDAKLAYEGKDGKYYEAIKKRENNEARKVKKRVRAKVR